MISIRVLQICNEDSCGNYFDYQLVEFVLHAKWKSSCLVKVNSRSYMRKGMVVLFVDIGTK